MRKKMRKIVRMQYEEATQVVGMAGLFLLLLLAGTAGAWIWSCRFNLIGRNEMNTTRGVKNKS